MTNPHLGGLHRRRPVPVCQANDGLQESSAVRWPSCENNKRAFVSRLCLRAHLRWLPQGNSWAGGRGGWRWGCALPCGPVSPGPLGPWPRPLIPAGWHPLANLPSRPGLGTIPGRTQPCCAPGPGLGPGWQESFPGAVSLAVPLGVQKHPPVHAQEQRLRSGEGGVRGGAARWAWIGFQGSGCAGLRAGRTRSGGCSSSVNLS